MKAITAGAPISGAALGLAGGATLYDAARSAAISAPAPTAFTAAKLRLARRRPAVEPGQLSVCLPPRRPTTKAPAATSTRMTLPCPLPHTLPNTPWPAVARVLVCAAGQPPATPRVTTASMPPEAELAITNSPPAAIAARRTMSRPRPVELALLCPRIATSKPPVPGPSSATSSRTRAGSLLVRDTAKLVPSGVCAKTLSTNASTTSTRSAPSMATGVACEGMATVSSRSWSAANADQKATRSRTTLAASHVRSTAARTGRRASLTTASTVC